MAATVLAIKAPSLFVHTHTRGQIPLINSTKTFCIRDLEQKMLDTLEY